MARERLETSPSSVVGVLPPGDRSIVFLNPSVGTTNAVQNTEFGKVISLEHCTKRETKAHKL